MYSPDLGQCVTDVLLINADVELDVKVDYTLNSAFIHIFKWYIWPHVEEKQTRLTTTLFYILSKICLVASLSGNIEKGVSTNLDLELSFDN